MDISVNEPPVSTGSAADRSGTSGAPAVAKEQAPRWVAPSITVVLQPEEKSVRLPRPKTVLQLLGRLGLKPGMVLVIRDGGLLTPDCRVFPEDSITIRTVVSSG